MRINPQQSLSRITGQPTTKRKARGVVSPTLCKSHGDAASPSLYDFSTPDGHIITPADSDLPPILAKYEVGDGNMPPALRDWLDGYDEEIAWWQSQGKDMDLGGVAVPSDGQTIGPLVKCKWHQASPYNQATVFGGVSCMTGCGATAIAQLLYYWGCQAHDARVYRRGCMPTPSYTSKTNRYKVAALPNIPIFDYENMTVGKPLTDDQKKAVAQVMLYSGCAVKSDYAQGVTTSYLQDLQKGLRDFLRLGSPSIIQYAKGAAAFKAIIIEELHQSRPCLLIGSGSQGGHFFICDGYNPATDLFHMNWGWGGNYDGWFALSALNPSKYSFSANKKAIVGIQPEYSYGDVNGDGTVNTADAMAVQKQILKGGKTEAADVNNDGSVDVADVMTIVKHSLESKNENP